MTSEYSWPDNETGHRGAPFSDERRAHLIGTSTAAWFAQISAELVEDFDEQPTVHRICDRVVSVLRACDGASVTVRRSRGRFETLAASSDLVRAWDERQYEDHEGPCMDAAADSDVIRSDDLAVDPRWPRWGPEVAAQGARSLVSVRLSAVLAVRVEPPDARRHPAHPAHLEHADHAWGAMNMYSRRPGAFDDDQFDLARVYVTHATPALRAAQQVSGLQTALESRPTIGMAQGILMIQFDLSQERAFQLLKRYSSDSNRKLRDVAIDVVTLGKLPDVPSHDA